MNHKRSAFTIVELLLVVGIVVLIGLVSMPNFYKRRGTATLSAETQSIAALLREAQSRSMSQASSSAWGVHFDNTGGVPFFALFASPYSAASIESRYALPESLQFSTATVPAGAFIEISFSQISGALAAQSSSSVAIAAKSAPQSTSTVSVDASGAISF